ncbi:uncharacterized protein LOC143785022 [Ranitomeya variabilis]|uniref:uncharacterized protein LOC143785022 n=1 Tax=Ranitomeya variabilis TaxID=490064 RepID=UPI004057891F
MGIGHSASAGPVYVTLEEHLRRLADCVMRLPSPLFQKERPMVTSPIAKRRRYAITEEEPARGKRKREERGKTLKLCNCLDEKEEEEKASKKIKLGITENELRLKTLKEMCAWLDEEEDEEEKKEEEEKAKKMKLCIRIPTSST